MFIQKTVWFQKFPPKESCSCQFCKRNRKDCNKDVFVCGVFLDFRKAFETVNHNILIAKRNHHERKGITLDWFQLKTTNSREQYFF